MRRFGTAACAAVSATALLLAGCTGDNEDSPPPTPSASTTVAAEEMQGVVDAYSEYWSDRLEADTQDGYSFKLEVDVVVATLPQDVPDYLELPGFSTNNVIVRYESVGRSEQPHGAIVVPAAADGLLSIVSSEDVYHRMHVATLLATFYADHVAVELAALGELQEPLSEVARVCLAGMSINAHMGDDITQGGLFTDEGHIRSLLSFAAHHRPSLVGLEAAVSAFMGGFGFSDIGSEACLATE